MTEDKPQHGSSEILNFQRFLSLVILTKRSLVKKQCTKALCGKVRSKLNVLSRVSAFYET